MDDSFYAGLSLEQWRKLIVRLLLPAIIILSPLYWFYSYGVMPGPGPEEGDEVLVSIPVGKGFAGVYQALLDGEVVRDDMRFAMLASWSGVSRQLKAGEYVFPRPISPKEVLDLLVKGDIRQLPVTIPEGLTIDEVALLLEEKGWGERSQFIALCHDRQFITELGLGQDSLEGYLFPDTYNLTRSQTDRQIIVMMVRRFLEVEQQRFSGKLVEADKVTDGLSRHQEIILASIVEKETGQGDERGRIARVFLNRLAKNMRLQADPTVIYGLGAKYDGNITRKDLRTPTPYNTYVIRGLPQGPIANPGRAALDAVANPPEGDWLYFVARGDGTHKFSTTLDEHNKAVRRYQLKR
ncbi:MAG: endolytic transglycosylase MltG [Thermodesulfobacteriota bacterium]